MGLSSYHLIPLVTFLALTVLPQSQGRRQSLTVIDAYDEQTRKDVSITCKEGCQPATFGDDGLGVIKLPPDIQPGDWITLRIRNQAAKGTEWVFISPWDGRVVVPRRATEEISIVVVRKGNKHLLSSAKAIEKVTEVMFGKIKPELDRQVSEEERKMVLKQLAEMVGFTPEELSRAILEMGEKAKDPHRQGLAALYDNNYTESTRLLEQSYQMRKEEAYRKISDEAFYLGQSLYGERKYKEAIVKLEEANRLQPNDANILSWLGSSLHESGQLTEAEPILVRALEIGQKTPGAERLVAHTLYNLGQLYRSLGKYVEAEHHVKRALEIRKKEYGPESVFVAQALNLLAELYRQQGKYDKAEPLFNRVLEVYKKTRGEDSSAVAQVLNNIANVYRGQRKYVEAEQLYKRALEMKQKHFPPGHRSIAVTLHNLGEIYQLQGKYVEAEPYYERALDMRLKIDPEHPDVALTLRSLANLYRDQGKYAEAEPHYKRALEIYEKKFGATHLNVANVLEDYAALLRKLNRDGEATEREVRAKEVRERIKPKGKD